MNTHKNTSLRSALTTGMRWMSLAILAAMPLHASESFTHSHRASGHSVMAGSETLASIATSGASMIEAGAYSFAVPLHLSGELLQESTTILLKVGDGARSFRTGSSCERMAYSHSFNQLRLAEESKRAKHSR